MREGDKPTEWEMIDLTPEDINTQNVETGNSYLHEAAKTGDINLVKHLVAHGADITLTNREGKTAKQLAIDNRITPLGSIYNKVAAKIGKEQYHDTEEVYNYLDQAEKDLAVVEARQEAKFKILQLQAELDMVPLREIGNNLLKETEELERKADQDDLKMLEEEITARTLGSGGFTDAEFDEDFRKITAELDEILAGQDPVNPSLPIENFSDEELDKLGVKLELEAMQELQQTRRALNRAIEPTGDMDAPSSKSRTTTTAKRPGGRF